MIWLSEPGSTDRELIARFERDVIPLLKPLYYQALRMSHNHTVAQDLVQDTMVKAFANFRSYRQNTNVNAWVYRILLNTYINAYRRKRRQPVQYSTEKITENELAVFVQHSPREFRSAEDEPLDALPDNDIKAAMQGPTGTIPHGGVLRRRRGTPIPRDRGDHVHPDRNRAVAAAPWPTTTPPATQERRTSGRRSPDRLTKSAPRSPPGAGMFGRIGERLGHRAARGCREIHL